MKVPLVLNVAASLVLLTGLASNLGQRNEAGTLRALRGALVAESNCPTIGTHPSAPVAGEAPLTDTERQELLRLRGQITQLRREGGKLEAVTQENASLKQRLAVARADPASVGAALPPGYILRRTARNAGQGTPQATVETFLWALENRDPLTLLQTLAPEDAQKLQEEIQKAGEEFWKTSAKLPGMKLGEQKALPDGSVEFELSIDIEAGSEGRKTTARLQDGRWRIKLR